ncbi:MAG: DNA primase [Pseudomonadota bacterium]
MRFPPDILDEIRARLPVSAVVSRKVPLKKQGRELAGLSPFKTEKTPSFFVNDQKGFYHCFASGEHGDIFTFLMKTEGLSFPEAVERLAQDAGVALPERKAADPKRVEVRMRLYAVLEAAAAVFQANLQRAIGREANTYLKQRGLDPAVIDHFRLGYAPAGRHDLSQQLRQQGFRDEEMVEAGLMIAGSDIPVPYDRFRNRVMFPILDLKGRVIAFGGRALDPNQPAKYLNSPETPLFHKSRVLFNAAGAREVAFETNEIVVVEGYMDVVALHQAGLPNCVAPLGTALTGDQIGLLWRLASEPTLCFDGDSAGRKAADRAVDTALPALSPGKSLRFAFLPEGLDPDDLVRQRGPQALRKVLDQAHPLAEVLWQREWSKGNWATPEQRALLEKSLQTAIGQITDTTVRFHYQQSIRSYLRDAWRNRSQNGAASFAHGAKSAPGHGQPGPSRPRAAPSAPRSRRPGIAQQTGGRLQNGANPTGSVSTSLRQSPLVAGPRDVAIAREALLVRFVIEHPWLLDEHAEEFGELPLSSRAMELLRDAILDLHARGEGLDSIALRHQLSQSRHQDDLAIADRESSLDFVRSASAELDQTAVIAAWQHIVSRHAAYCELSSELGEAIREFDRTGHESDLERVVAIRQLLSSVDVMEASD